MIRKVKSKDEVELRRIARKTLEPLYGNQDKALKEWLTGNGYKNAFVFDEKGIKGLLVLKKSPFKSFIKISTLLVLPESKGKKTGTRFLEFSENLAIECHYEYIIVTVSEKVPESMVFFQKLGFEIVDKVPGKYQPGVTEFILQKEVERWVKILECCGLKCRIWKWFHLGKKGWRLGLIIQIWEKSREGV